MPAIIDSAPECVTSVEGAKPADDSADFIIQAAYEKCAGHHDLRPRQHVRGGGRRRDDGYMVLTWIGIIVMVVAIVAWMVYEDRRLRGHARGSASGRSRSSPAATTDERRPLMASQGRAAGVRSGSRRCRRTTSGFELAMLALSVICMIVVLVIVLFTGLGNEFRPKA